MRSVGMGERFDSSFVRPGTGGTGVQPRAHALHFEGRLTDQLPAHSMSSANLLLRAGYGGGNSPFGQIHESNCSTPNVDFERCTGASPASWHDERMMKRGGSPEPALPPSVGEAVYSRQFEPRRPPRGDESFRKGCHYANSRTSPSIAQHHSSLCMAAPDNTLSQRQLKIYSDIFEGVIEGLRGRDKLLASLLRKIKTAYDTLLLPGRQQEVFPLPQREGQGCHDMWMARVHNGPNYHELSAASPYEGQCNSDMPCAPSQNQYAGQMYRHGVALTAVQEDRPLAARPEISASDWLSIIDCAPVEFLVPTALRGGCAPLVAEGALTMHGGAQSNQSVVHESRREPDSLKDGSPSLSKFPLQASPLFSYDNMSGDESDGSGIPQRPVKPYVKPSIVPFLDFAQLHESLAREEAEKRRKLQLLVEHKIAIRL